MSTYYINETMLGPVGTEADARLMVQLLQDMGQDVAYGHQMNRPGSFIDSGYWQDALDILAEINAPPMVALTPARVTALRILLDPDFADATEQAQAHVTILAMLAEVHA